MPEPDSFKPQSHGASGSDETPHEPRSVTPSQGVSERGSDVPGSGTAPGAGSSQKAQPRTVREMQTMARDFLRRKGVEEARLEADLLVAHALELDRLGMLLQLDRPLQPVEVDRARDCLVRRGRREPVAYITGKREFYGRPFHVGQGCLIPRPETEGIVDVLKTWVSEGQVSPEARILDWGTGSGCLAVTLALEFPQATVQALDVSPDALLWARRNGEHHEVQIDWIERDGQAPDWGVAPVDVLVSNPPYVDPAVSASLEPEVRDYEPHRALFGPQGDAGRFVRLLIDRAPVALVPGGRMILELGHDQGPGALRYAQEKGLQAELIPDLAGIERLLSLLRS